MVPLGQMDYQAVRDLLARLVHLVLPELADNQDQLDHQEVLDYLDYLDLLVVAYLARLGLLVSTDLQDYQEALVHLDRQASTEQTVRLDFLVRLEILAL